MRNLCIVKFQTPLRNKRYGVRYKWVTYFFVIVLNTYQLIFFNNLKQNKMKNAFKLGFLAFALSLSVVACSEKKADGSDTTMMDSPSTDTMMMQDTMMKDTMMKDTMMTDTMGKM